VRLAILLRSRRFASAQDAMHLTLADARRLTVENNRNSIGEVDRVGRPSGCSAISLESATVAHGLVTGVGADSDRASRRGP